MFVASNNYKLHFNWPTKGQIPRQNLPITGELFHGIIIGKPFKYWNKPQIQFKAVNGKTLKNKMRENEDQIERKQG